MTSPAAPDLAPQRKRTKISPADSSEPSVSSKSASQLKASSALAESTNASNQDSGDESSELSESSEEPSDLSSSEDDDDEEITNRDVEAPAEPAVVNLRANRGQKPTYKLDEEDLGPDIRTFLKDFLPQLKAANEELEAERKQGALKKREIDAVDAEEDEQYIEMNLGLGVLKMKDADASSTSGSDTDMSDDEAAAKEKDVLGKLMGQEKTKEAAGIQEVNDKQVS